MLAFSRDEVSADAATEFDRCVCCGLAGCRLLGLSFACELRHSELAASCAFVGPASAFCCKIAGALLAYLNNGVDASEARACRCGAFLLRYQMRLACGLLYAHASFYCLASSYPQGLWHWITPFLATNIRSCSATANSGLAGWSCLRSTLSADLAAGRGQGRALCQIVALLACLLMLQLAVVHGVEPLQRDKSAAESEHPAMALRGRKLKA